MVCSVLIALQGSIGVLLGGTAAPAGRQLIADVIPV